MTAVVRQVEGISIVAWDPEQPQRVVRGLRELIEQGGAKHVLLDFSTSGWIRADSLETLSEATTVCSDRGTPIGMFGVSDDFTQLIKVMSLAAYLPPVLGADESAALSAIQRQDTLPEAPKLDIQIDLATAPTARFDPQQLGEPPAPPPATPAVSGDNGLLAVNWADLTQGGYVLGGPGADQIMAACQGAAVTPPDPDEGVIDLGEDAVADVAPVTAEPMVDASSSAGVLESGEASDFSPLDDTRHDAPPAFMQRSGATAAPPPQQPQAAPPQPAAQPQPTQPAANMFSGEADDASVMMQLSPEALAAALQGYDAANPTQQEAASAAAQPAAAAEPDDASLYAEVGDDDQAVMFQPGAFDAALLAEVAAAAGPEQGVATPAVEPPPPAQPVNGEEGELRTFLRDYAIRSALHVQVLERFLVAGEDPLGPHDLQAAGQAGAMRRILDELVQARVVRRTRSSRIRGGTGFVFAPSPAVRNQVVRLIKLWQGPETRAQVADWLTG